MNSIFCVSVILGIKVTNAAGMEKVIDSNMTGPVFLKREIVRFKKKCRLIFVCLCSVDLVAIS